MTQPTLSFEDKDDIIRSTLDCLDKKIYNYTTEIRRRAILYTVTKNGKFFGQYGLGNIGEGKPMQGDGPEWEWICDTLLIAVKRANGTMTPDLEQIFNKREESYRQRMQDEPPTPAAPTPGLPPITDPTTTPPKKHPQYWYILWQRKIYHWVTVQGMDTKAAIAELDKASKDSRQWRGKIPKDDTMRKIIAAGLAGELDIPKPK